MTQAQLAEFLQANGFLQDGNIQPVEWDDDTFLTGWDNGSLHSPGATFMVTYWIGSGRQSALDVERTIDRAAARLLAGTTDPDTIARIEARRSGLIEHAMGVPVYGGAELSASVSGSSSAPAPAARTIQQVLAQGLRKLAGEIEAAR